MVTYKDAKEVAESIKKSMQPLIIELFGSVARDGNGTDLDLLVLVDGGSDCKSIEELDLAIHKILKPFYKKFSIDPFVIPLSLFNEYYLKGSPFLRLIFKEGRCLYMKDSVKQWLIQSEEELKMAEYLLKGSFFKGACYHSQQSIEKA